MRSSNKSYNEYESDSPSQSSCQQYTHSSDILMESSEVVDHDRYKSSMTWNYKTDRQKMDNTTIKKRKRRNSVTLPTPSSTILVNDKCSGLGGGDNTPLPLNINLKECRSHRESDDEPEYEESGTFSLSEQTGLRGPEKSMTLFYDKSKSKRCSSSIVNQTILHRHLTIAYRWVSHFLIGLNQLAAADVLSSLTFILVRKEEIENDNAGHVHCDHSDANGDDRCSNNVDARSKMDEAFTLISGLTELYSELAYSQLVLNHSNERIDKKVEFPSPSPSWSSLKVYSPFVSPGQLQLDIVPVVFIPSQALFDEMVSHVRMMESILTDTRNSESYPKHHNRVAEVDETVPAYPLLDPRMPWNGRLWLPCDSQPISSLPLGISREIQGLIDSIDVDIDTNPGDHSKNCKLMVPCGSPKYFLVADKLQLSAGSGTTSLLVKKDIEINKLRWKMAEKKNELTLELEETERLRARLASKTKEIENLKRSRQIEMKRRLSLRTENFDLKRLCDKYEELLGDLRSLVFVQSVHHSDTMKEVVRVLEEPMMNGTMMSSTMGTPQEADGLHATLSDWTVPDESSGVASATLRLMGEFDSVVDSAAEEIDRYRTAYQIDRARKERESVLGAVSGISCDDQYLMEEGIMRRPDALGDVDDLSLHFGLSYKNFRAISASHKAMYHEGSPDIETPGVIENPELTPQVDDSSTYAGGGIHCQYDNDNDGSNHCDENISNAEMLIGMLGRKLRRYEVLLEATSKTSSESFEEDDVDVMATAKELSMTSWCILKHVGERLIEVVANEEKKKQYKSFKNLWRMNRKIRRRTTGLEYDATNEKEKLLISVNRVIHRLYPTKPSPKSTNTLLESIKFPRRRSEGCRSVNEIIIELWDCLAFLAGAHPVAPPILSLPRCILETTTTATDGTRATMNKESDCFVTDNTERDREVQSYWPQAYNRPLTDTSFRDVGSEEPPPPLMRNNPNHMNSPFVMKKVNKEASEKVPIIRRDTSHYIGSKMKRIEVDMLIR